MNQTLFNEASRAMFFIFQNYKPSWNWEDPHGYCAWYISQGYMAMVLNEQRRIEALCTIRPVMKPGDGAIAYWHDPEGTCLFIDLLLVGSNSPIVIQGLRLVFQHRFGARDTVAYFRRTEQKLRIHEYDRFLKNISRTTRGTREKYGIATNADCA